MNFRYQELTGRSMPIVPIELRGKEWVSYDAYVDSGAGYPIFHSDVTDDLQIKLEDGERGYITVGDGSQIIIYLHKIIAKIATEEFKATIAFSRHLGIGFNIIGRKDIFEKFKICFDEKKEIVEFIA